MNEKHMNVCISLKNQEKMHRRIISCVQIDTHHKINTWASCAGDWVEHMNKIYEHELKQWQEFKKWLKNMKPDQD